MFDKFKGPLDWVQRWVALWQALAGLGLGKLVGVMLSHLTAIPKDWITPIWLIVSAAIWALLAYWSKAQSPELQAGQHSATQIVAPGLGLEENLKTVEEFYKKNSGQMLEEVERHFQRLAAHFTDPKERERFLIRVISGGAIAVLHDGTWNTIFRSQLELLQELNIRAMTLEQVKPYYDAAVAAYPETYKAYPFEQWLAYLRGQTVVLQDGNVVQLTVRGKDFLRYLVLESRSIKTRLN